MVGKLFFLFFVFSPKIIVYNIFGVWYKTMIRLRVIQFRFDTTVFFLFSYIYNWWKINKKKEESRMNIWYGTKKTTTKLNKQFQFFFFFYWFDSTEYKEKTYEILAIIWQINVNVCDILLTINGYFFFWLFFIYKCQQWW